MVGGLGFGLFAALMWGLTDVCAALASRRVGGLTTNGLVQLTSLAGLVAFAAVSGVPIALAPGLVGEARRGPPGA